MVDRDVSIITKNPPEQYSRIRTKEIAEEIKHLNEHENSVMVFDDFIGSSNWKNKDQVFIGKKDNFIYIYFFLSQS